MKSTAETLREYLEAFVVALILALFIRTFVVQAFKIPSESMLETLQVGDHLLVSKFSYGVKVPFSDKVLFEVGDPERGDIMVFEFPQDPSKDFIKRCIGLPGDTVEIRDSVVYINDKPLDEPYVRLTDAHKMPRRDIIGPFTVPEGKYFMLGDNRHHSNDSRYWGFVDREAIVGKAQIIYWSWSSLLDVKWNRLGMMIR